MLGSAVIDIPVTVLVCIGIGLRWIYADAVIEIMIPMQVRYLIYLPLSR
jgi:hypothetical protein